VWGLSTGHGGGVGLLREKKGVEGGERGSNSTPGGDERARDGVMHPSGKSRKGHRKGYCAAALEGGAGKGSRAEEKGRGRKLAKEAR